jgi:NAD-dependent dihydropyrimidine dehydrogenase PreA subunit
MGGYDTAARQRSGHAKTDEISFNDTRFTFTEEQMKKETERCLGCGTVVVNQEMCVGCGQCTTKCKFDAIKLSKKYDVVATTFEKLPLKLAPNVVKRVGRTVARKAKDTFSSKQ